MEFSPQDIAKSCQIFTVEASSENELNILKYMNELDWMVLFPIRQELNC
jgi:hypothetical protein